MKKVKKVTRKSEKKEEKKNDQSGNKEEKKEKNVSDVMCNICFEPITTQGIIDCCSHAFCFSCIKRWSEVI